MSNKPIPPGKPYVYAFSSGRLVLVVCIVLVLMVLSLMLGIRIERYQWGSEVATNRGARRATTQPPSEPVKALPKAGASATQPQEAAPVQAKPKEAASITRAEPAPVKKEDARRLHYAVQVLSSQDKSMASSQVEILKKKGFASYLEEADLKAKGRFFRVMVGPFQTETEAKEAQSRLVKDSRFAQSYVRYLP